MFYSCMQGRPICYTCHSAQPWLLVCCAGEFPWADQAGSSSAAARHYAQRYRQLQAQLDRSLEERTLLHNEVIRTFNWLEERQADIHAHVAALHCEGRGNGSSSEGRGSQGSGSEGSGGGSGCNAMDDGSAGSSNGNGGSSNAGSSNSRWSQLLADGQAAQLLIQLRRIQLIHDEACKLLKKYLPIRV